MLERRKSFPHYIRRRLLGSIRDKNLPWRRSGDFGLFSALSDWLDKNVTSFIHSSNKRATRVLKYDDRTPTIQTANKQRLFAKSENLISTIKQSTSPSNTNLFD